MDEVSRDEVERQRIRRIKRLKDAAEAEDLREHVSVSTGGVVFWKYNEKPVGMMVDELGGQWIWCSTDSGRKYSTERYATRDDAIRVGLVGLARQEEARG